MCALLKYSLLSTTLLILSVQESSGQALSISPLSTSYPHDTAQKPFINFFGEGILNSNALTHQFYQPFIRGGHIGEELKEQVSRRLKKTNRIGGDWRYGIATRIDPDSLFKRSFAGYLWVEYSDNQHFDAFFPGDLFHTAFYGNAAATGKSLDLSPFRFHSLRYQQMKIGWGQRQGNWSYQAGLGFVKGQKNLLISFSDASLTTDENGRSIDIAGVGHWARAGDSLTTMADMNGIAITADIQLRYDHPTAGRITFTGADLGEVGWRKSISKTHSDTSLHFTGFDPGAPDKWAQAFEKKHVQDSLSDLLQKDQPTRYFAPFPGRIALQWEKTLKDSSLQVGLQIDHRLMASYFPYFGASLQKQAGPVGGMLSAGYGGYGTWQFGIGLWTRVGQNLHILARSNHLEGWLLPSRFGGESLSLGITYEL